MSEDLFDKHPKDTGEKKTISPEKIKIMMENFGVTKDDVLHGFKVESLNYTDLDSRDNGHLYDSLNHEGILEKSGITSEYLKANFGKDIPQVVLGVEYKQFALYSAIAEEGNFQNKNGELYIDPYSGMNVRHSVVIKMLDEIMKTVTIDEKGNFHGVGKIKIDAGTGENNTQLTIDFDNNTINPPVFMNTKFGKKDPLLSDNIKKFLSYYVLPQDDKPALAVKSKNGYKINEGYNPDGIIILNGLKDTKTLTHEIHHGLFSAESGYRKAIYERVKATDSVQRDCATIFATSYYDVLDPNMVNINKNIVIDEVYNAYANEGRYDYKNSIDKKGLCLEDFCKKFNLKINLEEYDTIEGLGLSEEETHTLKDIKEMYHNDVTEKDFLKNQATTIVGKIKSVNFLYNYLQKHNTELFAKIHETRKKLVDWVDDDK